MKSKVSIEKENLNDRQTLRGLSQGDWFIIEGTPVDESSIFVRLHETPDGTRVLRVDSGIITTLMDGIVVRRIDVSVTIKN